MAAASSVRSEALILHSPAPGIAFDIEVAGSSPPLLIVPKRLRRRLEQIPECKSLEDIEAKLKDADARRQQFQEWMANKAKPRKKCDPSAGSPAAKDLVEKLDAKLYAAEQKRLELQTQEQNRLAKLHESRLAAKTEAELRAEREREELASRFESRVHQAESNRQALFEAERQRRAAANERIAHSILQRISLEDRDRERAEALRAAICHKVAAAEEKRACLIEAEKSRAQAIVLQARSVAKAVLRERELELSMKKQKLEARLLRAKSQRAELLRQKGGCRGRCHNHGHKLHKHGDRLCRKLTICWRRFRRCMKTTLTLAQEFTASGISQQSVTSLPFEQGAGRIASPAALRSVKALLARIESRLMLFSASEDIAHIDGLLARLSPPPRRSSSGFTARSSKRSNSSSAANSAPSALSSSSSEKERYPARVFLCAFMIVGHPDAVFSAQGEREAALGDAAAKLVTEFESLLTIVIDGPSFDGPSSDCTSASCLDGTSACSSPLPPEEDKPIPLRSSFPAQLASFDAAWHSYLCRFVAWKVKDAQLLEEDLIRVACQLEVSMLHKCKVTPSDDAAVLTHDAQAIRKQVLEDQRLLRDRVSHITGKAGCDKMDEALSAVRSRYVEAKENGVSLPSPFAYSSPEDVKTSPEVESECRPKSSVVRSLFNDGPEATGQAGADESALANERIVNEMLHDAGSVKPSDSSNVMAKLEAQIRTAVERAFWDRVEENLTQAAPDYGQVVNLVGEIRDDLESIAPDSWKQELRDSLDVELLSQVLESGSNDIGYLRRLLDYTLDFILRLGAPARDVESKTAHQALVEDLSKATEGADSFAKAVIKGIRFVFDRLRVLKQDISNTRFLSVAELVSGSAGIDYLQRAFVSRYKLGALSSREDICRALPRTATWLSGIKSTIQAQESEVETALNAIRCAATSSSSAAVATTDPRAPSTFPMCTGGRVVLSGASVNKPKFILSGKGTVSEGAMRAVELGTMDAVVRMGILSTIASSEAATEDSVAETLQLNVLRLRGFQNDFQRIVVIATGMLLLRQELMTKLQSPQLEAALNQGMEGLNSLLAASATVEELGSFLAQVCAEHCCKEKDADEQQQHRHDHRRAAAAAAYPDLSSTGELMTRVLSRWLSRDDAVFGRVTAAMVSSMRLLLLAGSGAEGKCVAVSPLKRVGAAALLGDVVELAHKLDKVATIQLQVHGKVFEALYN